MQSSFSDLAARSGVQQVLVSFSSNFGIASQLWDLDRQVLLASSESPFELAFSPDALLSEGSRRQDKAGSDSLHPGKLPSRRQGPGELFWYVRPVRIEDRETGVLILGPVLHTAPEESRLRLETQESGVDETAYREALERAPVMPEVQAEGYASFLGLLVQRLVDNGLDELGVLESSAALQEHLDEQKQAYHELEARIRERTDELERANAALQESEQRFRIALIDTPIVVFNQDLDLRYTWIYNPQNYADQPVVGKTDAELFPPEDAQRLAILKKRVMAAGLLTREEVSLTVGGQTLFFDMTLDPLYDADGAVTGLTCAATDITERKQLALLEERQRLARELHDSVTQTLYSVTLYADAARRAFSREQWQALEKNLQQVLNLAREAMHDMRLLVFEMRPFILEKEGLVSALRARLAAVEGRSGLQTEVVAIGERRLPVAVEDEIYRIAQEGLNNVVKHASARKVKIVLEYDQDSLDLEMVDDGKGFDPQLASQSGGVGLRGMQERVQGLGGRLEIKSIPGIGTRLEVKIPVNHWNVKPG